MNKAIDLTGKIFGRWTVLRKAYSSHSGLYWLCKCSCGNERAVIGTALRYGKSLSCGCLQKEICSITSKKYNQYDLSGEYGIGYTTKGEPFYFDLEDYDKIKDYCWSLNDCGYAQAYTNKNQSVKLHQVICRSNDGYIDHINHCRTDNRKCNLRIVTAQQNSMNRSLQTNNISGVTGVSWHKNKQKWQAYIYIERKRINLGYFDNFDDAVKARKQAEEKYFGEFSFDNSMKVGNTI